MGKGRWGVEGMGKGRGGGGEMQGAWGGVSARMEGKGGVEGMGKGMGRLAVRAPTASPIPQLLPN